MRALIPGVREHPIAVVAERTGLSQDVLRVWERRYGAVQPRRSAGGRRVYTDSDIERLRLLHAATAAGRSIGQIARLPTDAIAALVADDEAARDQRASAATPSPDARDVVGASLALAKSLDASQLDIVLRRAATLMGMPTFLEAVAAPLLRQVGDEWHAGRLTPAHEHIVSSILYDIIIEIMHAAAPPSGAPRVLVATAATERHTLGAALVGASAAVEGWSVIYLGADLPATEIADAARATGARIVAISIVYVDDRDRVLGDVRALGAGLAEGVTLIAGGAGAALLSEELSRLDVRVETSVPGLLAELRRSERRLRSI